VEADDLRSQDTMSDAVGDRIIADRLDAMEAERVLQRALELESESADEPHLITTAQLDRIATEIGVDPTFVHQALGELRLAPSEQSRFARFILGDPIAESTSLNGLTREDVDASIRKWMTQHEGMIPGGVLPGGLEWHVDRRWRTRVLARSMSGGNRISRVAGGDVTHRVHTLADEEHVVAMQSEGRWPLTFATLVLSVGTMLNAIIVLGAGLSSELLIGLGTFAGIAAATIGVAVGGARWWAGGIRNALRRSLIGFASAAKPQRTSWLGRRRQKSAERRNS